MNSYIYVFDPVTGALIDIIRNDPADIAKYANQPGKFVLSVPYFPPFGQGPPNPPPASVYPTGVPHPNGGGDVVPPGGAINPPGAGGGGVAACPNGPFPAFHLPAGSYYISESFGPVGGNQITCYAAIGTPLWSSFINDGSMIPFGRQSQNQCTDPCQVDTAGATVFSITPDQKIIIPELSQSPSKLGHYCPPYIGQFHRLGDPNDPCPPTITPPPQTPLNLPPAPGQNCGFYDCPSNTGTGSCCHDYTGVFASIASAIEDIALKMNQTAFDCSKITDTCLQSIADRVAAKLNQVKKTCQQCCADAASGLAQSAEDALTCSQMACNCAMEECQPVGSTSADGSTCENCSQSPCCCQDGECLPCETEPSKPWFAYCSQSTGQTAVTQDSNDVGTDYVLVGAYETEVDAGNAAAQYCQPRQQNQVPVNDPGPPPVYVTETDLLCSISTYATDAGLSALFQNTSKISLATWATDAATSAAGNLANNTQNVPVVGAVFGTLNAQITSPLFLASLLDPIVSELMGCGSAQMENVVKQLSARGMVEKFIGVDLAPFTSHISYAAHALCRNVQLSPGDATNAFLANVIDGDSLDAYYAIAGYCPETVGINVNANRSKFSPLELAAMLRRGIISQSEYDKGIRANGYIRSEDAPNLFQLTEQRPGISDIIRMMVRDTDDIKVVDTFDLDAQFTDKYGGQLKQWAADQGVPDKVMQYAWRAHWDIPSPTALYQMQRRLRHNDKFNSDGQLEIAIEQALVQQDILPYWVDKFLAIAYNPLSRVDVRRAFNIGTINEQQVTEAYWQLGYSDDDAITLTKFAVSLRNAAVLNDPAIKSWVKFALSRGDASAKIAAKGIPQDVIDNAFKQASYQFVTSWPIAAFKNGDLPKQQVTTALTDWGVDAFAIDQILQSAGNAVKTHPYVDYYAAGTADRDTATRQMMDYGIAPGRIDRLLNKIDSKFSSVTTGQCVASIKHRFLMGEFNAADASNMLKNNGIVPSRVTGLIDAWGCEKSSIGKAVPTADLCRWLAEGIIDPSNFIKRLVNIGYTNADAINVLTDCKGKINQQQAAAAIKQAKAEAAQIAKQQKQAQQTAAQLQRAQAQLERAQKTAVATRQRRSKQLTSAIEKYYAKSDADLNTIAQEVNSAYQSIESGFALSADETLQALLQASEAYDPTGGKDYIDLATEFAQAIVNRNLEPDEVPPV